ncbi:MAG: hypothetical protein QNJ01_05495 [Desulfobacterales bacterium]|nr:hypothetical protein [Desulfobacterales bacterium]
MTPTFPAAKVIRPRQFAPPSPFDSERLKAALEIDHHSPDALAHSLPFGPGDTTAGVENEIQAAVRGPADQVDLALSIRDSDFFENIRRMAIAGDTSPRLKEELERYLEHNPGDVWENSWVRFPRRDMAPYTAAVFRHDLQADKQKCDSNLRCDANRFTYRHQGEDFVRIPISYLMKLALAEVVADRPPEDLLRREAERLMRHYISDNTSPETHSFYTTCLTPVSGSGHSIASETCRRMLFSQLLVMYANRRFKLAAHGQRALIYMAPHPPQRQKWLNELIPDSFYRELFMSPCLSGWDRGEEKHAYMGLCHQVLSRSQLNAVKKLKDAGIISRNLVVLPNLSNICLANNGTHVSLGSLKLSRLMRDGHPDFQPGDEKYIGDLVIKIVEHFLPLFVGTYSGAPYRLDFGDMHPEKVLSFLPHELNFTHLRMIWRRWKKKARMKICGRPITPFGPEWLDRMVSRLLHLKGDFVRDFRLIDYLACLMSTPTSSALSGELGNDIRLKRDLAAMGIFDQAMPLYLLYRLRPFSQLGFSGFEGRHYSQFESLASDMTGAVNLQALVTALAFKWVASGKVTHADIPDTPNIESERRQIFFGAAIGLPTFFVAAGSSNRFLKGLVPEIERTRPSNRYPGYIRIHQREYCLGLLRLLRREAPELVEGFDLATTLDDLERRVRRPEAYSASGRLTRGILEEAGVKSALKLNGAEFNAAAEAYYRGTLRRRQMREGLALLAEDLSAIDAPRSWRQGFYNQHLLQLLNGRNAREFLDDHQEALLADTAGEDVLQTLIRLFILTLHDQTQREEISRDPSPSPLPPAS